MVTKLKAASRLTAYRKPHEKLVRSSGVELPKFRYLDDAVRYLEQLTEETRETDQVIKQLQHSLAYLKRPKASITAALVKAAEMEFVITDDSGGDKSKRSRLRKKINPALVKEIKITTPHLAKLEKQYKLAEDLYEKHRTLEAMQTQLSMQFPDRRGEKFDAALGSLRTLKDAVGAQLKEVLGFLSDVAEQHVPNEFKKYMNAVSAEVGEHVLFEDSNLFLYVHVDPQGELVFTYYLMLINATNDEGKTTPHLYISIQWKVTANEVEVQVNHEYEPPAKLLNTGGTAVDSAGEAVKAISHLLDLEDFSTSLGTLPLSQQFRKAPDQIDPNMFSFRQFIGKLEVENDELVFKLRKGVSKDQAKEIAYQLYQEVKQLVKRSRTAKLKVTYTNKEIRFHIVSVAQGLDISTYDAEFLKDRFGLTDQQLKKVVHIINQAGDSE